MKLQRCIVVPVLASLWLAGLAGAFGLDPSHAGEVAAPGPGTVAPRRVPPQASPASSSVVPSGYNFPIAVGKGNEVAGKPAVAFDGTNFFVVWRDASTQTLYGARVSQDGTVLDASGITISTQDQENKQPSVVFDGTHFFLVWAGRRANVNEVYGARVSTAGVLLDPNGIKLTTGANPKIRMLGVAFDGTNLLVVWRTLSDRIYAARVSPGGVNLDAPAGFGVSTLGASYYPAVAFDGTNYLVVWHDGRSSLHGWDVYGARVTTAGQVLDFNGFVICDEEDNQEHSMVAFDGLNYLVVWYDWRPKASGMDGTAYGARVSTGGTVLDDPPFQIGGRVHGEDTPRLTCAGGECLVVYHVSQDEINSRGFDIYGHRISQGGAVLGAQGIPVATAFGTQFGPSMGYGEGRYLVVWGDSYRSGNSVYAQLLEAQTARAAAAVSGPLSESPAPSSQAATSAPVSAWLSEPLPVPFVTDGIAFSAANAYAFSRQQHAHYTGTLWQAESFFPEGTAYGSWASGPGDVWLTGWCRGFNHFDGHSWADHGCWSSHGNWDIGTAIWGSGPTDLWASADRGDLLRYDGVHGWTTIPAGVPYDLADLWGTAPGDIYAVGERGTVLHYNGSTWNQVSDIPTVQTLNGVWGGGSQDIFVVGDWGTILHYDGMGWDLQASGTPEHLFDVWGSNGTEVYAVGLNGTILHYDGTNWQPEASSVDQDLWAVWGAVDLRAGAQVIWAAGRGNAVLKKTVPINVNHVYLPVVLRQG